MNIGVCGKSVLKLNAALIGFTQVTRTAAKVAPIDNTPSDINEQPINEETKLGMMNRLNHAIDLHKAGELDLYKTGKFEQLDYIVAFENGLRISEVPYVGKVAIDEAWSGIWRPRDGKLAISTSAGVVFTTFYVDEAQALGFDLNTVGSLMARYMGLDGKNPHLGLCQIDRERILSEAAAIGFGSLIRNLNTFDYRLD